MIGNPLSGGQAVPALAGQASGGYDQGAAWDTLSGVQQSGQQVQQQAVSGGTQPPGTPPPSPEVKPPASGSPGIREFGMGLAARVTGLDTPPDEAVLNTTGKYFYQHSPQAPQAPQALAGLATGPVGGMDMNSPLLGGAGGMMPGGMGMPGGMMPGMGMPGMGMPGMGMPVGLPMVAPVA